MTISYHIEYYWESADKNIGYNANYLKHAIKSHIRNICSMDSCLVHSSQIQ